MMLGSGIYDEERDEERECAGCGREDLATVHYRDGGTVGVWECRYCAAENEHDEDPREWYDG